MKKYMILLLVLPTTALQAQTWSEWFRQKKTQIKYLTGQIAALKAYGDYTQKGYEIAEQGLRTIHRIKEGDFSLHQGYISSLGIAKPQIKGYWKVADIVTLQLRITQLYQNHTYRAQRSGLFTPEEIKYLTSVFTQLLNEGSEVLKKLVVLTSDDGFELKDNERIKRIDALHANLLDKYAFARHFELETTKLAIQRRKEKKDAGTGRAFYGIH
jgi:hypothetical protein